MWWRPQRHGSDDRSISCRFGVGADQSRRRDGPTPAIPRSMKLMSSLGESAESILQFWFATERSSGPPVLRARWFAADPEFDQLCKGRFLGRYDDASAGRLDDWKNEPRSCLALVLLVDQFPRNMFRGTARAFATDAKARELSRHAIASGFDRELSPPMRFFFYLPLEHSENLDDQLESERLTSALVAETGFPDEVAALTRRGAAFRASSLSTVKTGGAPWSGANAWTVPRTASTSDRGSPAVRITTDSGKSPA